MVNISAVDPCHFGMDPDPEIRITELRIRIRVLLLSSLANKQ